MELIPGELEEEVTAMSGGALEPDQFVVSGKREEALLQEEEPLPSQPISYGVWLSVDVCTEYTVGSWFTRTVCDPLQIYTVQAVG